MKKEEIEFKLECIEAEIEMLTSTMEWSKKTDRSMVVLSILGFTAIMLGSSISEKLNVWHVLSISLMTCSSYKMLIDMVVNNNQDKHKLQMLELDKQYYQIKLKYVEGKDV